MGNGRKLERFGRMRIARPEPQAIFAPRLDSQAWQRINAGFTSGADSEGGGRWQVASPPAPESWDMSFMTAQFSGKLTKFRHIGVFPEQASHWQWIAQCVRAAARPPRILNLFGYTGIASIIASQAGAEMVTHVDASPGANRWARANMEASGRGHDLALRWITEDAMRFVMREIRRGNRYDGIILDPPKFGHGPKGEIWDIQRDLPDMLDAAGRLLSRAPLFLVLSVYAIRLGYRALGELLAQKLGPRGGHVEAGELLIEESDQAAGTQSLPRRTLSTSLYARWHDR